MVRCLRGPFLALAGLILLGSGAARAEDLAQAVSEDARRQALSSIAESLEKLKDDPAARARVVEQIDARESTARGELNATEANLAELRAALEQAERTLEELKRKQESLQVGRALLGLPQAPPSATLAGASSSGEIDFNRDIRPLLSNNCFNCHGPDDRTRKAGLRFDDGEGGYKPLASGSVAIVPGDRNRSELYKRLIAEDDSERMPPSASGKSLTPEQIELIGKWIDSGAVWKKHWSLVKPECPNPPEVAHASWPRNAIDQFILARMEREGLTPSPEADKRALIRRVTFALTGLPPTMDEIDAFLRDESSDAYEKVVDRLLASPAYAEHMTRFWLDTARYADTNGYHIDNERFMWRWRDWVIEAFRSNMPFDQFAVEQLAGDLLPKPTLSQLIATGFCRNHMITFEGGTIPEEYRIQYVIDRLNTTGTVFLGMTIGCAQCHEHKFDPISQHEYYQLFAFFNTIPEQGIDGTQGNSVPSIKAPLPEQERKLAELRAQVVELERKLAAPMPEVDAAQTEWEKEWAAKSAARWVALDPRSTTATGGVALRKLEDGSFLAEGANPDTCVYEFEAHTTTAGITAIRLEALADESMANKGAGRSENSNFALSEFEAEYTGSIEPNKSERLRFLIANADHSQNDFDIRKAIDGNPASGWAVEGFNKPESRAAIFVPERPFGFSDGGVLRIRLRFETQFARHSIGRPRLSITTDEALSASTLGNWSFNGPYKAPDGQTAYDTDYGPEAKLDLAETYPDGRHKWFERPDLEDGKPNNLAGESAATYLHRVINSPSPRTMTLATGSNDAIKVWVNGHVVLDKNVKRGLKENEDTFTVPLERGENNLLMKVVNYGGMYSFFFRRVDEQVGDVPMRIERILASAPGSRSEPDALELRGYYRRLNSPEWKALDEERLKAVEAEKAFEATIPTTMVMREMEEPRETFVLNRGQYDQPGDKVLAALPSAFPPLPEGAPSNRLGLAKWLVDPANPLTARVTVNRFWQQQFGVGIVETAEDFGTQGTLPSHPELLDWLATEFVRTGWDVKALHRLMVTSAAFRQSSKLTPLMKEKDPGNRLLARGPRYRMDAEVLRDTALALGGILVRTLGGPSVRPYQPPGLWEEMAYGDGYSAQIFVQDHGEALYRRSMYTFWKRQVPPPNMQIFDAPSREVCQMRRPRTNTPLQALALLNDPQVVEAARHFAARMMTETGGDPMSRAAYGFTLATARTPSAKELAVLVKVYEAQLAEYKANTEAATKLLTVGESPRSDSLDPAEHAAWTVIASLLMNLDETVTLG